MNTHFSGPPVTLLPCRHPVGVVEENAPVAVVLGAVFDTLMLLENMMA